MVTNFGGQFAKVLLEDGGFAALADTTHGIAITSLATHPAKAARFGVQAQVADNRVEAHHKCENDQCLYDAFAEEPS